MTGPERTAPTESGWPFPVERYCVWSKRAVSMIPGDRCRNHGGSSGPCLTDVRPPQCEHSYPSPNHPIPTCSECGRRIEPTDAE